MRRMSKKKAEDYLVQLRERPDLFSLEPVEIGDVPVWAICYEGDGGRATPMGYLVDPPAAEAIDGIEVDEDGDGDDEDEEDAEGFRA